MKLFIAGEESEEKALEFSLRRNPLDTSQVQLMVKLKNEDVSKKEHLLTIDSNGRTFLSNGINERFGLRLIRVRGLDQLEISN